MSTATIGTQTLKERAAEAHDKIKREQDARHDEEYREQCDMLAKLAACADCWAWIKRDESHTCKQQIGRNQRKENTG